MNLRAESNFQKKKTNKKMVAGECKGKRED
jgi:hypothetical protein